MNNIRKAGRYLLAILATLLLVTVVFAYAVQFRDTDAELRKYFAEKRVPFTIGHYSTHNHLLRYLMAGNDRARTSILFIHGAPSSMSYFKTYLTDSFLVNRAHMLAVDRPGYGYSGFGKPETSLARQSLMIRPLLDSLQKVHHPLIVVGVSYGTSVACRLAMDYPALVDGLVLVAPALAPGEEKTYSFAHFIERSWVKWLIPSMLASANTEKLHHKEELQKMLPYWKSIRVPVMYLQGALDELIYPSNAMFARTHFTGATCLDVTMIPGRGHLIAFSEKKRIDQAIREMMRLVEN